MQLGAFRDGANARRLAERAAARGLAPVVREGADGVFRVLLPAAPAAELDRLTRRLVREGFERFLVRQSRPDDPPAPQPVPVSGSGPPASDSPIQAR